MNIIRVENLGKKYTIRHKTSPGVTIRQPTFREAVGDATRTLIRRFRHPLNSRPRNSREDFWALKDVSFEVQRGDRVGIIGRNGAGKSTLLKILSRITEPTTGRVEIDGRVASLLEVGTGFHPELSGRENIFLNGAILGMRRAEIKSRFDEIVAFADVERFLDTPVKRYSSGMYVRLAFAVAAHLYPEILIVDEVLAVGDAAFQRKCLGRMKDVSKEGRTVIFVSHNMAAIENLCQNGLVLEMGRAQWFDTIGEAIASYAESTRLRRTTRDLTKIADRQGNGKVVFRSWGLEGAEGNSVNSFSCGEPARILLHIGAERSAIGRDLSIAVGLDNAKGNRICRFSSDTISADLSISHDREVVEIEISSLAIMPGEYTCTLFCTVDGNIADWIQSAFSFEVMAGDFYGSGRLPPPNQGDFLMAYSMESRER